MSSNHYHSTEAEDRAYDAKMTAEFDAWWNALSPEEQADMQAEWDADAANAAERHAERFLSPGYGIA